MKEKLYEVSDEKENIKKDLEELEEKYEDNVRNLQDVQQKLNNAISKETSNKLKKEKLELKKYHLETSLAERENQIVSLKLKTEDQDKRLLKLVKKIDKLRGENNKFKENYNLARTFSPKKYWDNNR